MTLRLIPRQEYGRNIPAVVCFAVVYQTNAVLDDTAEQYANEVAASGADYFLDQKVSVGEEYSAAPTADTATRLLPEDIDGAFLESVYECSKSSKIKRGILFVFRRLDDLLSSGKFTECDELMSLVNFDQLQVDLIMSFFTITWAAREKLPHRQALLKRAKHRISVIRDPATADQLLDKLK